MIARTHKAVWFVGLALYVGGCSDGAQEPTGPALATTASHYVTISGPTVVKQPSGQWHSYHAATDLLYPSFIWYTRSCNTITVASCTTTWLDSGVRGPDYGTGLSATCPRDQGKSFQLKVVATGFASGPVEDTHVTTRCNQTPI
jgi:hypothetical protein